MNMLKKTLLSGAALAVSLSLSLSGVAQAQPPSAITPTGPIAINGYISADNTAKGGVFPDFRCKVEGWGFIDDANPAVVRIDFLRPLNESSGDVPRGCHTVATTNYPWTVTLGAVPAGAGALLTTTNVTVTGAAFQAAGQPGCGYPAGSVITTAGAGIVTWSESNPAFIPPGAQNDNTHTRLVFDNAVVDVGGPNCTISGALKFSRWTSIHAQP